MKEKLTRDEVIELIKNYSYSDCETIVLGKIIELKFNDDCIDIYKYKDADEMDEDYDFDSDYITTVYC